MNKSELINSIATKSKLSKKDSENALNALIASIGDGLKKKQKISLIGFGSFEVKKRAARKGLNPQTKKTINIPAKNAPVFRAGKGLKDLVNKKK